MKRIGILIFVLFLVGCVQEPVKIVYNDKKLYTKNNYVNYNYNKGSYKTLSDGRIVRDITLKNEEDVQTSAKTEKKENNNELIVNKDGSTSNSYFYVIVKPEDSLYRISKNNNIELSELAKINGISEPYNIVVGQKIKIPHNNSTSISHNDTNIKQNNGDHHIVKQGETLYSISKAYNIDMDQIIKVNNLEKPYNLSLGQKLLLNSENNNKSKDIAEEESTAPAKVEKVSTNIEATEFIWPVKGEIMKKFGEKINDTYFDGISIKSQKGVEIKASKSGEVAYSGNELKGYGNIIILRHENNWLTIYAHCDELKVKQGEKVNQGDIIATIGDTGNVNSYQLYFSIREGREAKDPLKFLK